MDAPASMKWRRTWALVPRRTIGGRWVWLRSIYHRRVWVYTGFVDEPEDQYAGLLEILADG